MDRDDSLYFTKMVTLYLPFYICFYKVVLTLLLSRYKGRGGWSMLLPLDSGWVFESPITKRIQLNQCYTILKALHQEKQCNSTLFAEILTFGAVIKKLYYSKAGMLR